ncbi:CHAT domain-containing protein [Allorhodopirellula solitaria]|uniref:CHAT domain protein n=1 Tax=Allorhodopirellula solitaria TaxID=2527987 RepID=A0A5C5XPG0_9BACT|nr:CHAT domain-containing protein [Allorhodopirellula solitaria]TWT65096.1 CHAT domain protein [Allorhodopirellula solitaria]
MSTFSQSDPAFMAQDQQRPERETRTWLFLFYLCGDHGQWSRRIQKNLKHIRKIKPSEHVYVAVQHDLAGEGAHRFVIADESMDNISADSIGEINTGDPETALKFFRWGIQQCPARHIALIFGGTGIAEPDSIVGNVDSTGDYEQLFAFCDDGTAQDALNPVELGEVLAELVKDRDGKPIDLIAFDMCSMQFLEIAYQLRSLVHVMVGSENNEQAPEWSYAKLINGCAELLRWKDDDPLIDDESDDDPCNLIKLLKDMRYANPRDPRAMGCVLVRIISETYHSKQELLPVVSALDLSHLERITRSLDTFLLVMLASLGNPVVWEMRDRVFRKLVAEFDERNDAVPDLRGRELIAYDLLVLLQVVCEEMDKLIEQGPFRFWYRQQLTQHFTAERKERIPEELQVNFEHAFKNLMATHSERAFHPKLPKGAALDAAAESRRKILETMWHDFQTRDSQEEEANFENAAHLLKVTQEVATLFEPAATELATSGQSFVLASEPRADADDGVDRKLKKTRRCGVLIHRPQHLDRLINSGYLDLDFHQHVHWVSLLGAINLISNHPGEMWRLISSLLSTASAGARDDLLKRLTGPDSVISGAGSQFRALRRPPCVTLSINEETIDELKASIPLGDTPAQRTVVKRSGYRVVLESSRLGATVAEQFSRVNEQTIRSTLSRLEGLLQRSWVNKTHLKTFESLGRLLGEDVIQRLHTPLNIERQHVQKETPDQVLHLQLQLPLSLMRFPWELMHDGTAFLGERYALGRQLAMPTGIARPVPKRSQRGLKVLIIGDPILGSFGGAQQLPRAREEAEQVVQQFKRLKVELGGELNFQPEDVRINEIVTTHQVREWLREGKYDIIHFAGHAEYVEDDREQSAWILSDGPLWAVEIRNTLANAGSTPWLVYANACESSMGESETTGYQSDVFGLATAFINQGVTAYIGPLWPIDDAVAMQLATDFYDALLLQRESVGEALRIAKARAKQITVGGIEPSECLGTFAGLSWASLILYGNPTMKLMDTFGMQSIDPPTPRCGNSTPHNDSESQQADILRRRKDGSWGTCHAPLQRSVSTLGRSLSGPGMSAKMLRSRDASEAIPDDHFELSLVDQNGLRYWQVADGEKNRPLPGSIFQWEIDRSDSLRQAFGIQPRVFSPPLTPRPIGHWIAERSAGSVAELVQRYDSERIAGERLVQVNPNATAEPLGQSALSLGNYPTSGDVPRTLLILHDTLCDTESVLGMLQESFSRRVCRKYAAVVGFDHHTLSKSPLENANALARALQQQLGNRVANENCIDILAHGRGGLVAKALIECHDAKTVAWDNSVRKIIFAGVPHGASRMLHPDNWGQLADLLINMSHLDGTGMYASVSGLLARLAAMQQLSQTHSDLQRPRDVPGLAALDPNRCTPALPWPSQVERADIVAIYDAGRQQNVWKLLREGLEPIDPRENSILMRPSDLISELPDLPNTADAGLTPSSGCRDRKRRLLLATRLEDDSCGNPLDTEFSQKEGIHRTNMLSVDRTQDFIHEHLAF